MRRSVCVATIAALPFVAAPTAHALPAWQIAWVAVHPWRMEDARRVEHTFADIAATGAKWVRVELRWLLIEPDGPSLSEGRADWQEMDAIVAAAERHGLELLPVVAYVPEWASPAPCGPTTPSVDDAAQGVARPTGCAWTAGSRALADRVRSANLPARKGWGPPLTEEQQAQRPRVAFLARDAAALRRADDLVRVPRQLRGCAGLRLPLRSRARRFLPPTGVLCPG